MTIKSAICLHYNYCNAFFSRLFTISIYNLFRINKDDEILYKLKEYE